MKCQQMQTSSQWIHNVQQGETIWKPVFHMSQNLKKYVYFVLFGGPWGDVQRSDWAYIAFQLSSHPYLCTCKIWKYSDKKFLSLNPKYEKIYFFSAYLGGPGGPLTLNQVNENFRAVRSHHRADICITREQNNHQFYIYGSQYKEIWIFGYSGGGGGLGGP